MYPKTFQKLIRHFSSLPSVGPKMAERLVLFLFKQEREKIEEFSKDLAAIKDIQTCQRCFNVAENELCEICRNPKRDHHSLCVVEEPLDILSIERTRVFNGVYHVLGGVIDSGENNTELTISQLLSRIPQEEIKEVIIATNPTTEGDATAFYLKRKLKDFSVKVSRLGRGMSTGGDIEYADEMTLSSALTNRQEMI